jgi:hypothetical protein
MTVRPGNSRPTVVITALFVAGVSIAIGAPKLRVDPVPAVLACVGPVLVLYLTINVLARSVRLKVSENTVLARQGGWRGHPDLEVPRDEIRAIHYFSRVISFRGPDDEPFMRIDPNYTLRQMTTVARLLGVPLYDHKRWLGLREVRMGRLVYDPTASDRVS